MVDANTPPPLDLRHMSGTMRRWILEQSHAARVGHIGSGLSIVEMMAVLFGRVLREPGTDSPDRDRFILCKGHAALALYGALRYLGIIDDQTFGTYCRDGSLLGVHPEPGMPGVEVGTGSLGQGLSVACGQALSLGRRGSSARVFALLSDAECNEGQVWEAVMLAAHHKLRNLVALVDCNGMQAMGPTKGIIDLSPMGSRWAAFGWRAVEVDGHDTAALAEALTTGLADQCGPVVIIANTSLGKGVSFMENRLEWHYRNLSDELAERALQEVEGQG
jgi:transketolase